MNDDTQFEGAPNPQRAGYSGLAQWLQQVMQAPEVASTAPVSPALPASSQSTAPEIRDEQLELLFDSHYHLRFYQQLPDFVMALLTNEPQVTTHYAPLLYHLAGCAACHQAYVDLYDALREAVQPRGPRPLLGQGTRTLDATPQRMLGHLCRTLISQAEAVLLQERRDHSDTQAAARSLLQLALRIGSHIGQSTIRRQALHDLLRVATITEGQESAQKDDPGLYSYTLVPAGAGGVRGRKTFRRADMVQPSQKGAPEQMAIPLQARNLSGTVVQRGNVLELHLKNLDAFLRGHRVRVSILLGSLLEPVRWRGGNPHAILSPTPVEADGTLVMPLGETDLRLSIPEEYHLLETMFMLVEVRKVD
jgi:hypothetical protein